MNAYTIRVASLDPGQTTGLAIADVHVTLDKVTLLKFELGSYSTPHSAARKVLRSDCSSVVIENMPVNASLAGRVPFDNIISMLTMKIYVPQKSFMFQPGSLLLITPGLWKPVMKAQHIIELGSWEPKTQHEKDALNLLHYAVKLNHMSKEIYYA